MVEEIDLSLFRDIIKNIYAKISEKKMFLSELDSVIGDGDHGVSLAKGLKKAVEKVEDKDPKNIRELLVTAGNAITITIGGVTGPVFGMFFSEMGKAIAEEKLKIDIDDIKAMFENSLEKVQKIGGASPGDKTMVDALSPAVKTLAAYEGKDIKQALLLMAESAKKGAESTKEMIAKKGRARYSGDRSLGFEDAGANSIYFMMEAFYETL